MLVVHVDCLDAETLQLLENLLVEYTGTVLLVSHDREFLNNVVTSTLVFEGEGRVKEYAGGYDDWLRQRVVTETPDVPQSKSAESNRPAFDRPRKLTYREQQELDSLPKQIETLESEQAALHRRLAEPTFYVNALSHLSVEDQAKIMGGNLGRLVTV